VHLHLPKKEKEMEIHQLKKLLEAMVAREEVVKGEVMGKLLPRRRFQLLILEVGTTLDAKRGMGSLAGDISCSKFMGIFTNSMDKILKSYL
jgi:hypothetical protein